ncbi:MAG TPA: hypothetical protein VH854_04570 [Thermoanaerobaculia bacterium]|nr:hypothetical protein [Thermoanaerobaculia bacterium]
MTPRRWIEYLISVLVGNAIYFAVLLPGLPRSLQHQPFALDAGLLLAFLCCVLVYAAIRLGSRHGKRMAAEEERQETAPGARPTGVGAGPEDGPPRDGDGEPRRYISKR